MGVRVDQVKEILLSIVQIIEENRQYLTDLDAAIGDGDHGINLAKGFKQAAVKLQEAAVETPSELLKITAMALISNVGGAAGPLYGTFFMKAAAAVKDKEELSLEDFHSLMVEGVEGIKMRGKAEKGEKTMLDVLIPVSGSIQQSLQNHQSVQAALAAALETAQKGVEYTKEIKATKGRASYLGERSIGHIDPGAMSSCLMIQALHRYFQK